MLANMALAKGHSSKTKSQVSDIRTIGPVVKLLTGRLITGKRSVLSLLRKKCFNSIRQYI